MGRLAGHKTAPKKRLDGLLSTITGSEHAQGHQAKGCDKMAMDKENEGKYVTIGAKVTKEKMAELDRFKERQGIGNNSDLIRAAVNEFLRMHSEDVANVEVNHSVTNEGGSKLPGQPDICTEGKGLSISPESASIGIQSTGQVLLSRLRSALFPKRESMGTSETS